MKLKKMLEIVTDTANFVTLDNYLDFCRRYLEFTENTNNIQAKIIAQNEHQYFFLQYKQEGNYQITRLLNSELFYDLKDFESHLKIFNKTTSFNPELEISQDLRNCVNSMLYTVQQCIGSTLDGLPIGLSNKARKINGVLFEKLIIQYLNTRGIIVQSETLKIPIIHNNQVLFNMKYQHDLVIRDSKGDVKIIGAVKTTSKDRIDKVFIDKLLYSRLTSTELPHIAIILNDVQRQKGKAGNKYNIRSTFLPGRFKGYMIKLCPLDGVYYFDHSQIILSDKDLQKMIKPFDKLVFDDLLDFINH